jgi:hypothetical protein
MSLRTETYLPRSGDIPVPKSLHEGFGRQDLDTVFRFAGLRLTANDDPA